MLNSTGHTIFNKWTLHFCYVLPHIAAAAALITCPVDKYYNFRSIVCLHNKFVGQFLLKAVNDRHVRLFPHHCVLGRHACMAVASYPGSSSSSFGVHGYV